MVTNHLLIFILSRTIKKRKKNLDKLSQEKSPFTKYMLNGLKYYVFSNINNSIKKLPSTSVVLIFKSISASFLKISLSSSLL